MELDIDLLQASSYYAASRWCPVVAWREDAASAAIVRILEKVDKYDSDVAEFNTWVVNLAKWGVQDYLRSEWGRNYVKMEMNHLRLSLSETVKLHYGHYSLDEILPSPDIPADNLVYIAMRCDNIDKIPKNLTVAQQRYNLPAW